MGPTHKKLFEIRQLAKNSSPILKFDKLLYRSEKTIRRFSEKHY